MSDRIKAGIGKWSKKRIDFLEEVRFTVCPLNVISKKYLQDLRKLKNWDTNMDKKFMNTKVNITQKILMFIMAQMKH